LLPKQKGSERFVANQDVQDRATEVRIRFINYLKNQSNFSDEDLFDLVISILDISKKCKTKTVKMNVNSDIDDEFISHHQINHESHHQNSVQ
jgi:hypothetical protein